MGVVLNKTRTISLESRRYQKVVNHTNVILYYEACKIMSVLKLKRNVMSKNCLYFYDQNKKICILYTFKKLFYILLS